jgi:ankyrin repeat protein
MKTKWLVGSVFLAGSMILRAQTNDLSAALRQGLFEEEANRNLDAAISNYQALAMQFDRDRQIAATAIFRLGECYRKLGRTNDAVIQYERIIREFPDQPTLATLSRQDLAGLGSQPATVPAVSKAARQEQKRLLEEEIKLVEVQRESIKKQIEVGRAGTDDLIVKEREILELRRQLAALDTRADESSGGAGIQAATVVPDDEDQEIQRIQAMIRNSPDLINASSGEGKPAPLGTAAYKGQLRVATFLLANGADVNFKVNDWTPLFFAAANGHRAIVELLLAKGADVNTRDSFDKTPLHLAAERGFQSVAEALLAGKAEVNARNKDQETPLHLAARKGHTAMVAFLLVHQAEPNAQSKSGQTPVSLAAQAGDSETLNKLLAAGANPDIEDSDGRTPLSHAVNNGHLDSVKALLAAKADPNGGKLDASLLCAIHIQDAASAELLLKSGANPNLYGEVNWQNSPNPRPGRDRGRTTPLYLAISTHQLPMVNLLLKFKADPNDSQSDGHPLLFSALSDTNILEALLDAGADPNQAGADGEPPLMKLYSFSESSERNVAFAKLLVAHGAKVNVPDKQGTTPFEVAVVRGDRELIKLLLANKADVNVRRPSDGATVLHLAVQSGNRELIELILASKADVNARDNAGKTPLDYAKPQAPPGTMTLPLSYQWSSGSQGQTPPAPSNSLAALLRQHGALDDLPKLDRIEVRRPSANLSHTVFRKETNDWNRFTLLELIGRQYGFVSLNTVPDRGAGPVNDSDWNREELRFPEFRKVTIQRVMDGDPQRKKIEVDVESLLASGDCSRDVALQWGDRVEIPETDHPVDQPWSGLTANQITTLAKCVSRNVSLIIKGATNSLTVGPCYRPYQPGVVIPLAPGVEFPKTSTDNTNNFPGLPRRYPGLFTMQKVPGYFMLTAVLRGSGMLRASSDLSRVKVTRRDPKTGKRLEWVINCAPSPEAVPVDAGSTFSQRLQAITELSRSDGQFGAAPDLWLRDGDVIEVPEK